MTKCTHRDGYPDICQRIQILGCEGCSYDAEHLELLKTIVHNGLCGKYHVCNCKEKKIDRLEEMFSHQFLFQTRLGVFEKTADTTVMAQHYIDRMLLSIHEEAAEIGKETLSKHKIMPFGWKENQVANEEKYREEIVDLWHFVMNLWLAVDGTPEEFFALYCKKNKINYKRQDEGY